MPSGILLLVGTNVVGVTGEGAFRSSTVREAVMCSIQNSFLDVDMYGRIDGPAKSTE